MSLLLVLSLISGLVAVLGGHPALADTPAIQAVSHFRAATFNIRYSNSVERWDDDIANLAADNDVVALQEVRNTPYAAHYNEELVWPLNNPNAPLRVFHYDWNPGGQPLHVYKLITQGQNRALALVTKVRADNILMLPQDSDPRNYRPALGVDIRNAAGERGIFYSIHTNSPGGPDGPATVELAAAAADPGVHWAVMGDFNREPTWVPGPAGARIVSSPTNTYPCNGVPPAPVSNYDYMVTNDPDPALSAEVRSAGAAVSPACSDHYAVQFSAPAPPCAGFGVREEGDPCVPPIPDAVRSTSVSFRNLTNCDLTLEQRGLQHGIWSFEPPPLISRDRAAAWASESAGIMTGTEGYVRYVTENCLSGSDDNRQVQLHWDNPYIGSNGYDEVGTDLSAFKVARSGGVGNNTVVTWTVQQKPLAVVAMGDSYISGEAGRWAGNANTGNGGSAWGTDRAAYECNADESGCQHDSARVYGDTGYDGGNKCDRSDVSEISGAEIEGIPRERRFNLACSGATTEHVVQSGFKGEEAQVAQLRALAKNYRIRLVVLSVGGNDLDFSGLVAKCAATFMANGAHCDSVLNDEFQGRLGGVEDKVVNTMNSIHDAMSGLGYDRRSYRLVAQSYPGPIADADHYRYPGETYNRYQSGGCPFYDDDATWARRQIIPAINTMLKSAARRGDAFSLDLQNAFTGHELCSSDAKQATAANSLATPLTAADAEWVRWVPYLALPWGAQGSQQEAIHPNAYGQQALSSCLTQAYVQISTGGREFRCSATPGSSKPSVQTLTYDPNYRSESVNRAADFLIDAQDRSSSIVKTDFEGGVPIQPEPAPPTVPGLKLGVPQSYARGHFAPGSTFGPYGYQSSFTYDNAVVIHAFLQQGTSEALDRARILGNSLLYAQAHDPVNDGRIRASYLPDPFVTILGRDYPVGTPYIGGWSVYTGNMAWAGMAFCHLYKATGDSRYLDGALRAANWIQTNSADDRGAGGYTGGYADISPAEDGSGMVKRTWKATEHNIDVGAFFAMLNQLTGDQVWKSRSDNAFAFVKTMLSADGNHLWTGTGLDGVTVNEDAVPEDIQTWSYLATRDPAYERTVDWVAGRMAATDGPADPTTGQPMFSGVSFSAVDTSGVWFEGTAHLLAAYQARAAAGDSDKAAALMATLQKAQAHAPNADGSGIVAASHDGLDTGQGDRYYASLHTGATAWYVIAAKGANPFRL
ncbi:endonuclease/exonuclease/phosphatase family protein [Streptomyces sp. NPDC004284]|uniref:endonuclease/exonuclease/phosphatase family protein n=1 Tax=Streptomyces sp. NPDC004284 TaxID=3364695 RepID=UPI0036B395C3